jgi:hypothetical protein
MPEISRFLGIIISILYDDHSPPHFHARYAEYELSIEIETGVITGTFPRRALSLLLEWYLLHKDELRGDWELAREHRPLNEIRPLE